MLLLNFGRMRSFLILLCIVFLACASCERDRNRGSQGDDLSDSSLVVSIIDSLQNAEGDIGITHPEEDGSFGEFIYRFVSEENLQRDRIKYPLKMVKDGTVDMVPSSQWKYDPMYALQDENTLILGSNGIPDVEDTAKSAAVVQLIDLRRKRVREYKFVKMEVWWVLYEISESSYAASMDSGFWDFYGNFSRDEAFQQSHVHDPFYFKTYDSDNFEEIAGWVAAVQWPAYRTYLPADTITNIIYDGKMPQSLYRTFVISSPSSGMNCSLIFKMDKGHWELVRLEN